jgi:hypothetical protein
MLATSQSGRFTAYPTGTYSNTRDRICPCPVGIGWVGTGLAPGGFAGMACL